MARHRFDITSKWLLHHMGKGALSVGGLTGVRGYQPMPGEISQSRKFPDGLLQVHFEGAAKPQPVLVEVATYPEKRALKQAFDDLTLSYNALGRLPELLMLILAPKGKFRIEGKYEIRSPRGLSCLTAEWKPVEVWTLLAEPYLESGDVAAIPWATLMRYPGRLEELLERCRERIDRDAGPREKADLLASAQVLATLKFPDPALLKYLGGEKPMIESPLIQKLTAERSHKHILDFLKVRFGVVPVDVVRLLHEITSEKKLSRLLLLAGTCPDMDAFRETLLT